MSKIQEQQNLSQSLKIGNEFRNKVYNLNLNYSEDMQIYEDSLFEIMLHAEGIKLQVYNDYGNSTHDKKPASGSLTIAVGFNMQAQNANLIWNNIITTPSFQDVINGAKITYKQAKDLYIYKINEHRGYLLNSYCTYWHKLRPNERGAIELGYYNIPKNFSGNSELGHMIKKYIDDTPLQRKKHSLEAVVQKIEHMSDLFPVSKVRGGLIKRRKMEANIFDSYSSSS